MNAATLFLLVMIGLGLVACDAQPQRRHPIIDMHLHAVPVNSVSDEVAIPGLLRPSTDEALMRETLGALERSSVVRAIVSGSAEMVGKWQTAEPDRLIPASYIGIIPAPSGGVVLWPELSDLRTAHSQGKLRVLGEIGAQYMGLSLSSPEFEPYLALAEELDIPIAVHTGSGPPGAPYQTDYPKFRAALGNPLLLEEALVRHPKLRPYIMHGGYPFLGETITLLTVYPQVYVDLAVINWVLPRNEFHNHVRQLMEAGFGQRLMFGSDQMVWPQTIEMGIAAIASAEFLTEDQKQDILCRNAARFLRLESLVCE